MTASTGKRAESLALATKLEAMTEPDRHVGRLALLLCGKGYISPLYRWLDPTASLDAALSLVPEGWGWQVKRYAEGGEFEATVWGAGDYDPHFENDAASPALALTASCLKARAAMEPDDAI